MTINDLVGKRIKHLRQDKNWTIEDLEYFANVNRNYISDLERGKRNPTIEVLARIIDAFGITFAEFFKNI